MLCLALIHHVHMPANIPNAPFLKWLRSLQAAVILGFVNHEDQLACSGFFATSQERKTANDSRLKDLHAKIGELALANDFLAKALGR